MTDLLIILLPYVLRFLKDPWSNLHLLPAATSLAEVQAVTF